jgi:hypothetical protein
MAKFHAAEMAELARTNITGKRKPAEYTPSGLQVIGRLNGSTWQGDGMRRLIRSHSARRRWGGAAKREICTFDRPHCGSRPPAPLIVARCLAGH